MPTNKFKFFQNDVGDFLKKAENAKDKQNEKNIDSSYTGSPKHKKPLKVYEEGDESDRKPVGLS